MAIRTVHSYGGAAIGGAYVAGRGRAQERKRKYQLDLMQRQQEIVARRQERLGEMRFRANMQNRQLEAFDRRAAEGREFDLARDATRRAETTFEDLSADIEGEIDSGMYSERDAASLRRMLDDLDKTYRSRHFTDEAKRQDAIDRVTGGLEMIRRKRKAPPTPAERFRKGHVRIDPATGTEVPWGSPAPPGTLTIPLEGDISKAHVTEDPLAEARKGELDRAEKVKKERIAEAKARAAKRVKYAEEYKAKKAETFDGEIPDSEADAAAEKRLAREEALEAEELEKMERASTPDRMAEGMPSSKALPKPNRGMTPSPTDDQSSRYLPGVPTDWTGYTAEPIPIARPGEYDINKDAGTGDYYVTPNQIDVAASGGFQGKMQQMLDEKIDQAMASGDIKVGDTFKGPDGKTYFYESEDRIVPID